MDNIIFMSEIVEAASNVDNKVTYLNTTSSNIVNKTNEITNQITNLPNLMFPDITVKGFSIGPLLPAGTYKCNTEGNVLLFDAWQYNANSEGSKKYPNFSAFESTEKVTQGKPWTAKKILTKYLIMRDSHDWTSSSGSWLYWKEAWSTPISVKKDYAYKFENPICFIPMSVPEQEV